MVNLTVIEQNTEIMKVVPPCPVFGQCGGCQYQDIPYSEELKIKEETIKKLLQKRFNFSDFVFDPIVPSPKTYHYRHRLDLKFLRTKSGEFCLGFSPLGKNRMVPIEICPIALQPVSNFLPQLEQEAIKKIPSHYRNANLVVKTGDDGRVFWGGIGRRSLCMAEADYLWTDIDGKKVFYSLETFFQANLSILPCLIEKIQNLNILHCDTTLFDCYGGVGLFGICFACQVKKIILIEECSASVKLAGFNVRFHQLSNFEIVAGKVEQQLPRQLSLSGTGIKIVIVDPPRKGLSEEALHVLVESKSLIEHLLYLSCHPESLVRDLQGLVQGGWKITKVIPFDFFPRTKHLETLVLLVSRD